MQSFEALGGKRTFAGLEFAEHAFELLAEALDLAGVHRAGRALEAVRRAKEPLDNRELRVASSGRVQFEQPRAERLQMLPRLDQKHSGEFPQQVGVRLEIHVEALEVTSAAAPLLRCCPN